MTSCHPWAFSAIQDGAQDGCQHKVGLIKQDTTEVFKILFLFQAIKCIAEMSNLWFMSIWCLLVLIIISNMATKMDKICSINHSFGYYSKTWLWKEDIEILMVFVSIRHALSNSGGWHRVILEHWREDGVQNASKQAFHWFSKQNRGMSWKQDIEILTVLLSIGHALSNSGGWHRVILGHWHLRWRPKWLTE